DDDVAHRGVLALGAAQDLDAEQLLRAGVVGDVQRRLHLDHRHTSTGRSSSRATRQRLSRDSGRLSTISTRSPILYSFFSSSALYLVRLVMNLWKRASLPRRGTMTTTVFCIWLDVPTPMR